MRELQTAGADFDLDPERRLQARPRGRALDESHRPRARRPDRRRGGAHADRARAARASASRCSRRRACSTSSCDAARASACARASPGKRDGDHRRRDRARDRRLRPGLPLHDESRSSRRATASPSRTAPASTLADMEFVQFHPTALDTPENPLALISRGGARRRRDARERRAASASCRSEHTLAELAPRDVVARAIFREQKRRHACISTRGSSAAASRSAFPGIFALCAARGIDPRKDLIPVTPAAHYMMGGVVTDLSGRSSMPRLYAVRRGGAHRACTARTGWRRTRCSRGWSSPSASRATWRRRRRSRRAAGGEASGRCRRSSDRGAAQVAADRDARR